MEVLEKYGSNKGRTPVVIIILMISTVFFAFFMYAMNVNLLAIIIIVSILNFVGGRYLYLLFGNKPIIYLKKNYLYVDSYLFIRRKIPVNDLIEFKSRILFRRLGFLTIKHYKESSICEIILGGNVYEHDLVKLPNLLNRKISKYNQSTKSKYSTESDKSTAVGVFSFPAKALVIMALFYFPISVPINQYVFQPEINSLYVLGIIVNPLICIIIGILYFKHILANFIFQYVYYFLVVYPFILFIASNVIYVIRFIWN